MVNGPFNDWTTYDHLNTGLVRYLDPHCIELRVRNVVHRVLTVPLFFLQAFKAEWEALEVTEHSWALKNAEQEMVAVLGPTNDNAHHQIQRS